MNTTAMTLFTIDTLQFSKRLQKAGLDQKIAEELSEAIKDTQTQSVNGLATKHDISLMRKDFEVLEKKFDLLEKKVDALEPRLLLRMFILMLAAVSIVSWLDKVIN